jgi:hypothetical protein
MTVWTLRASSPPRIVVALLAAALVLTLVGPAPAADAAEGTLAVPAPVVEGPIPATVVPPGQPRDYPFMATPIDLAARGYVEEEYFISKGPSAPGAGDGACTYTTTPPGATGSVANCDGAYKTRLMVRRPSDPARFNGTVLLEWQNVTAQYDVDHYWLESNEHILREGYAWVGVSAQRAGVHPLFPLCVPQLEATWIFCNGLRTWSPLRYGAEGGDLNIPNDNLSFDIFAQAAQALRSPDPAGPAPLGELVPETVLALGTSQSAGRLTTYHNAIHPLQADPVVDAFFLGEARTNLRTDLDVPVLRLLSEVDVAAGYAPADADTYRHWEVAGSSHADAGFTEPIQAFVEQGVILQSEPTCNRPAPSRIPKRFTYHAAWDAMVGWVQDGTPPPIAPRIDFEDGAIVRDAYGNAQGGIQLSEHAVATAYNGTGNGGGTFCNLFGVHEPFTDAQLRALYRNPGSYTSQVARVNNDNRRAGYLVAADSAASTEAAARSTIGRRR